MSSTIWILILSKELWNSFTQLELIVVGNQVCILPQHLPEIMAKFISPKEVRKKLKKPDKCTVNRLNGTEIEVLLLPPGSKQNIRGELEMMCHLGVCYKIIEIRNFKETESLFPSLAEVRGIIFMIGFFANFGVWPTPHIFRP